MRIYLLLACLTLTACATVTAESDQAIDVTTTPPGAACVLRNGHGDWKIAAPPGTATVKRAYAPLHITCSKPGYGGASAVIEGKTRGRAYGNLLLLGLPAIIDASTGAGYEYDPSSVALTLQKK